jgi:hypothetical protein
MRTRGGRHADQGAIWRDIAEKSERLGAPSSTGAMDSMFEAARGSLDQFAEAMRPVERQVGAVFAINGFVVGLDLFDSPSTWQELAPKLTQSYGLDALDRAGNGRLELRTEPADFLRALSDVPTNEFKAIGEGSDLRIESGLFAGGALAVDGSIVHLVAFCQ